MSMSKEISKGFKVKDRSKELIANNVIKGDIIENLTAI